MTFAISQLISNSHLGPFMAIYGQFRIIRPIFRHFPQVQNPACSSFQVAQICFGTGDLSSVTDRKTRLKPQLWPTAADNGLSFSPTTAAPLALAHRSA